MLTNTEQLSYHSLSTVELHDAILYACKDGEFDIVHYIFTAAETKDRVYIYDENHYFLRMACHHGYLDIIEFLLESPELKEHSNILAMDSTQFSCLDKTAKKGNLPAVKYIINFLEKNYPKILNTEYEESAFITALQQQRMDVIEYFIFERQLEKTSKINTYITIKAYSHMEIDLLFSQRDLKNSLDQNLSNNQQVSHNRMKI